MEEVLLDASAGENGLALMIQGLLFDSLASDAKRKDFESMSSSIAISAPDAQVQVTLVFGEGRCTIYDGILAKSDVTITADSGRIPEIGLVSVRYGLPWLLDDRGRSFVRALVNREIRVDVPAATTSLTNLVRLPTTPMRVARAALDLFRLTRILSAQ